MAPVSRIHTPMEIDLNYDLQTRLYSLRNNQNSVDCQPWNSRGRRLFPQRRPSIPTSVRRNSKATPGFQPSETWPSRDHSPSDHQECNSNTSSPSSVDSVGTVKVRMLPPPDQPFPGKDPRVGEHARIGTLCLAGSLPRSRSFEPPVTHHRSSNKELEATFSAPLYTDTPARGNLQWKSMAQFHSSGRRLGPRTLSQVSSCKQTPIDPDRTQDLRVPTTDISNGSLPLEPIRCQWSQSPEVTAHPKILPIESYQNWGREEVAFDTSKDQSRLNVPALEIAAWDCTVKLSTAATITGSGTLHVHHLAVLSVIMPSEEHYAEEVILSFVVTNALRNDHKRSLGPGQSSLLFKEDISQPHFFPRQGSELVIVRDSCDADKPLNLYFAFTYPSPCSFVMASLPTFRPTQGRALSEFVFITQPLPPLSMETSTEAPLSSWRLCHHPVGQPTCYERIESIDLPQPCPAGFQDDIQMTIFVLDPIRFRALRDSDLSSVIWRLDIAVHEYHEGQMECRMGFFLEVGAATTLVSLVPHGWIPQYFVLEGRIATEKAGECWKNKEGHITIFKQAYMTPGPILVETYWQGPPTDDIYDGCSTVNLPLPRVADREVLGGKVTCRAHNEVVLLNHFEDRIRPHGPVGRAHTILPTMDAGYSILIKRVTEAPSRKFRRPIPIRPHFPPIPGKAQFSEHAGLHSDAETNMNPDKNLSHVADNLKHVLQALLLSLLVLLLLVPGFLLFVEHVRKADNLSTTSLGGQTPQMSVDAAALDPLQPQGAAADGPVEIAKCEGWRDWIDYGSGWKGCIP